MNATRLRGTRFLAVGAALSVVMIGVPGAQAAQPAGDCYDESLPITVEESRLAVPTVPGAAPASEQLLEAGGFQKFVDKFNARLCQAPNLNVAERFVEQHGQFLWTTAVKRAQGQKNLGTIDSYDDRPLYWAHLSATSAIRQWDPDFGVSEDQRAQLIKSFRHNSRGHTTTDFPRGENVTRVLVSGFDPYRLQNEPRRSNPSGVIALQLDGLRYNTGDGLIAVETVVLPVTWSGFDLGIVEDAFGPHLTADSPERADIIMTISQGGSFDVEQWAGRWRAGSTDNNDEGEPEVIPEVDHWPMPQPPPEFIETTLPYEAMIAADTGPFGVELDTTISELNPVTGEFRRHDDGPSGPPWVARSGGGGSYLSNESMYRSNRVRLGLGQDELPGGHLHTPAQTYPDDDALLLDEETQARRHAIADQAVELVKAAAEAVQLEQG